MSRQFPVDFPKIGDVVRMEKVASKSKILETQVVGRRFFSDFPVLTFSDGGYAVDKSDHWTWEPDNLKAGTRDEGPEGKWKLVVLDKEED